MPISDADAVRFALPGATDHGGGVVSFAIFAPRKNSVHLLGDFNDYQPGADALSQREPGYWVAVKHLPTGPARYQFLIDGDLLICDPYAQGIEEAPGRDEPAAVIDVGRPIYQWRNEGWQRPPVEDLIIYELHVGDFSPEGVFRGVTDRLDYLEDLGVNALEFMPLCEKDPDEYWGYKPMYPLAVRRDMGSFEDLLTLIDEAHGRGIAVILDLVLAHTAVRHPFNRMYPYEESPWYGPGLGEPNQFALPTLDFSKPATNSFIRDVQSYWLRVLHVDGFRYDYLPGIGQDLNGQGVPYLMSVARDIRPRAYLIGEYIPEVPDTIAHSDIDAVWHERFRIALQTLLTGKDVTPYKADRFAEVVAAFDPATQGYGRSGRMINYAESHDLPRIMQALADAGLHGDDARRRSALAASVLATLPGEPMLFHGQECGFLSPK
ncbi:MAG: hypothetical protein GX639_22660, partial [Fibrobacter sp.]|nr:hypothetical protein [Fibrobacter sp.]